MFQVYKVIGSCLELGLGHGIPCRLASRNHLTVKGKSIKFFAFSQPSLWCPSYILHLDHT